MDSSSRDENDNDPFKDLPLNAVISSTPSKKAAPKFVCPHCSKSYVSNFYFLKHIRDIHEKQAPPADLNVSLAVHIDTHDISVNLIAQDQCNQSGVFQVPRNPPKKTTKKKPSIKPQLICTYCLKAYVCSRSFKNHLRAHSMQEASARFPDAQKILDFSLEIGNAASTHVANSPSEGETGQMFKELVGHIAGISMGPEWSKFCNMMCQELISGIATKKFLLPSALATNLIDQVDRLLSDYELSDNLLCVLNLPKDFNCDTISQFMLEFTLNFMTEVLKFISKTFRENIPRRPRQATKEPDKEERQVIYYIAGSIMRGYLKIARRAQKSTTWQSVAYVIKTKVLVDKFTGDLIDSEWTMDVDRGGLLYVNEASQTFFVQVTKVVYEKEKSNGSIDYMEVVRAVTNSSICMLWDNIISDSLPELVSLNLMNDVILCLCKTCGRGFAKRRLNSLRSKPMVSLTTRHLVASRKNR